MLTFKGSKVHSNNRAIVKWQEASYVKLGYCFVWSSVAREGATAHPRTRSQVGTGRQRRRRRRIALQSRVIDLKSRSPSSRFDPRALHASDTLARKSRQRASSGSSTFSQALFRAHAPRSRFFFVSAHLPGGSIHSLVALYFVVVTCADVSD